MSVYKSPLNFLTSWAQRAPDQDSECHRTSWPLPCFQEDPEDYKYYHFTVSVSDLNTIIETGHSQQMIVVDEDTQIIYNLELSDTALDELLAMPKNKTVWEHAAQQSTVFLAVPITWFTKREDQPQLFSAGTLHTQDSYVLSSASNKHGTVVLRTTGYTREELKEACDRRESLFNWNVLVDSVANNFGDLLTLPIICMAAVVMLGGATEEAAAIAGAAEVAGLKKELEGPAVKEATAGKVLAYRQPRPGPSLVEATARSGVLGKETQRGARLEPAAHKASRLASLVPAITKQGQVAAAVVAIAGVGNVIELSPLAKAAPSILGEGVAKRATQGWRTVLDPEGHPRGGINRAHGLFYLPLDAVVPNISPSQSHASHWSRAAAIAILQEAARTPLQPESDAIPDKPVLSRTRYCLLVEQRNAALGPEETRWPSLPTLARVITGNRNNWSDALKAAGLEISPGSPPLVNKKQAIALLKEAARTPLRPEDGTIQTRPSLSKAQYGLLASQHNTAPGADKTKWPCWSTLAGVITGDKNNWAGALRAARLKVSSGGRPPNSTPKP